MSDPSESGRGGLPSLSALEGLWHLSRVIDHEAGGRDVFEGRAEFTRSGHVLIQDEEGTLHPANGGALHATRRYLWRAEGRRLDVAFADNRPFHTVPLGVLRPETTYLCPPDRYHVGYDFTSWPDWRSTWTVEGPRKAYRMTTDYRREPPVPFEGEPA
jgi:hypothetical protein